MEQPQLPGMPGPKDPYDRYLDGELTYYEYMDLRREAYNETAKQSILDYDPNEENLLPWGTYVPNRSGQKFKVHKTRGHARNATTQDVGGIYRLYDGRWILTEVRRAGKVLWENETKGL